MPPAENFRQSARRFNTQAAAFRQALNPACVKRYVDNAASGDVLAVTLSAIRREEELTSTGVTITHRAQLRVAKGLAWSPVETDRFVVVATGEVFLCRTATGANSPAQAEIVCDVVRVGP